MKDHEILFDADLPDDRNACPFPRNVQVKKSRNGV